MRLTRALAVAALTTVVGGQGKQVPLLNCDTGNQLLELCTATDPAFQNACSFYIAGVHDTMVAAESFGQGVMGSRVCVGPGQLVDIVVRSLRENPEHRHTAAAPLVAMAISKAFPCRGVIHSEPVTW